MSVIIPARAEDIELARAQDFGTDQRFEVILVAGSCRGFQMNLGAARSSGDWLLFLHADTQLPAGWLQEVERASDDPNVVGGYFRLRIASPRRRARLIEWGIAMRVKLMGLPYGDHALFVRRDVFARLGGFRDIPLMEDIDFVRRLRRAGGLLRSCLEVSTSPRRWEQDGWLRRTAENIALVALFFVGVSPKYLARIYDRSPSPAMHPVATVADGACESGNVIGTDSPSAPIETLQ